MEWTNYKIKLYCENGYNLTVRPSGEILGTQDDDDPDTYLEIKSAGQPGLVRIQGLESQLYACFDHEGNLYGESDINKEGTIFYEHFQGSYSAYKSETYPDWFIGIKKTGKFKKGARTGYGQKAVKFLPRRINSIS